MIKAFIKWIIVRKYSNASELKDLVLVVCIYRLSISLLAKFSSFSGPSVVLCNRHKNDISCLAISRIILIEMAREGILKSSLTIFFRTFDFTEPVFEFYMLYVWNNFETPKYISIFKYQYNFRHKKTSLNYNCSIAYICVCAFIPIPLFFRWIQGQKWYTSLLKFGTGQCNRFWSKSRFLGESMFGKSSKVPIFRRSDVFLDKNHDFLNSRYGYLIPTFSRFAQNWKLGKPREKLLYYFVFYY